MPKGKHLGSQNGTKIDPKMRSKFKSEKVASWDRLGSIWGRFGGCPGGIFIGFLLVFVTCRENPHFRCSNGSKTVLGRNLVENDAKLGSQNDPKSIQNRDRKLVKILLDFGSILERQKIRSTRGSAAEAWALPCTLPSVSTLDFEEIVHYIL